MATKDSLGDRMKHYEGLPRTGLMTKVPVMARFDGKAFHTLTRKFEKPYDVRFQQAMWETAAELCRQIQGSRIAFVQSDEISILLLDTQTRDTQAWFDYDLQKCASVGAGIASTAFNVAIAHNIGPMTGGSGILSRPVFDARFWNVPEHELVNYFIWRQQDATRNSIQGLAQSEFSQKQLHGLSCDQLQEKLFQERGTNWNNVNVPQKRGVTIIKSKETGIHKTPEETIEYERSRWVADLEIPVFTQDRNYLLNHFGIEGLPPEPGTTPILDPDRPGVWHSNTCTKVRGTGHCNCLPHRHCDKCNRESVMIGQKFCPWGCGTYKECVNDE